MSTRYRVAMTVFAAAILLGCSSPEATRVRGGGPGADVGNRSQGEVRLHAGSSIYYRTPTDGRSLGWAPATDGARRSG